MRSVRLIPVLLIHRNGIYKSINFSNYKYIGDPINAIRIFNDLEVDEICILDIDVSKNNESPNYELIEDIASEAFMPFSYGGGIKTVDQAKKIFNLGIEKIIVNHVIHQNLSLITECAERFGSQSIIASIDFKKNIFNKYLCYDHVSKKKLNTGVIDLVVSAEKAGAGEILINSVDRDGLMTGMDIKLINELNKLTNIPIIACGGAGNLEHVKNAMEAGANAIAAGSMFVFHGNQKGILINYPEKDQLEKFLK